MDSRNDQVFVLKEKVAVVTGSTRGIGAGIAKAFAKHGARVVIHGLDGQEGQSTLTDVRDLGGEALLVVNDLREEVSCRGLIRRAIEHFGALDILVNNAAVSHRGNIEDTSVDLWNEIFATNLRAPFILCQESVAYMKVHGGGCILNIGSMNAYVGAPKLLAYSSAKGGLTTFTKNLANYLAPSRIRVNQINPGWVLTEGENYIQCVVEGRGENWLDEARQARPSGRLLVPDDIASAALFFATNQTITGAVLDYEQVVLGALPQE